MTITNLKLDKTVYTKLEIDALYEPLDMAALEEMFGNTGLPQIRRVMLGKPGGRGGENYGYMQEPIKIELDRPAGENMYIQLWRYSSRRSQDKYKVKAAFRPIDLHQIHRVKPVLTLDKFLIPVGATQVILPTPMQLYKPPVVRGKGSHKQGNKYIGFIGEQYANRCIYRFSVAVYGGKGSGIYQRGNPSSDIMEIMWWGMGVSRHLIARLNPIGM